MTKIGVIINQGKELGAGLEELRAVLAELGHADPEWCEVPKSKKAPKAIRGLVDDGVDRLLVWGGDGTVRRSIHTLVKHGLDHVAVGILPAGTANLLAHNLQIPIDLREATEIAVQGDPRPVDLGKVNGTHFAVMAGTGFDALMIRSTDEADLTERFGKAGYIWAAMKATDIPPAHATIAIDGEPWYRGEATCVLVANVGTILGGIDAFPNASPTDGRLDVGVVQAKTKPEWLRLMSRALVGRAELSPLADTVTADTVDIRLDRTLPWEVDGGGRKRTDRFKVRCVPSAIRICQPWSGS